MNLSPPQLTDLAAKILGAAGADEGEAGALAEILVWCDAVGRPNQGVWRLPILTQRLEMGLFESPCRPQIHQTAPSLAVFDGDNGLGHVVARGAMDHAIAMARETGIGIVVVHGGNFFGASSYYVQQAASAGMIGFALSNSFPKVAAYGGVKSTLGTNPFAFGAPRANGEHFLLDMATSASAGSAIRKLEEQGGALPEGIAVAGVLVWWRRRATA